MKLDEARDMAESLLMKAGIASASAGCIRAMEVMDGGWLDWQSIGFAPSPLSLMAAGIFFVALAMIVRGE